MRVGIIGGGQLGQMLALASRQLGVEVVVLAHKASDCALEVTDKHVIDKGSDGVLKKFFRSVDVVTIENEFIDLDRYERVLKNCKGKKFFPTIKTLRLAQNKLDQKKFLRKNKIPTLDFLPIQDKLDFEKAYSHFDGRVVFKQGRLGYDGRGTFIFNKKNDKTKLDELEPFFGYAEALADFKKELAVVIARSSRGEINSYPTIETHQRNGICHWATSPASLTSAQNKAAQAIARKVVKKLGAVGVFTVEMFLLKNGKIIVNEIAPRVHNSGHLTQNACLTSQFEQHLRAILGFQLGSNEIIKPAAMVNIIGVKEKTLDSKGSNVLGRIVVGRDLWFHWYGKTGYTKNRKLGHINAIGKSVKEALGRAQAARKKVLI